MSTFHGRSGRRAATLALALALTGALVPAQAAAGPAPTTSVAHAPLASALERARVTLAVSARGRFLAGERLWVAGRVAGESSGRTVRVQARTGPGDPWRTVSTGRTRAGGRYTVPVRADASGELRAVASRTSRSAQSISPVREVTKVTGQRSRVSRAKLLGSRLGKATSSPKRLTRAQAARTKVKGVSKVVQQRYSKGLLVEVTTSSSRRAWLVEGKILSTYLAAGGPTGRWGVPTNDARCGLARSGCVQSFSRGTLYSANGARGATTTTARGAKGEVFAAARSQVGYKVRYDGSGKHRSRYNTWVGSRAAWCSIYLSWSAAAVGSDAIPREKNYRAFVAEVRDTMRTGSRPRSGAIAFVSTRPPHSEPNHVLLVTSVSKDGRRLQVLHGNWTPRSGYRGVLEQTWISSNRVLFYAYPRY